MINLYFLLGPTNVGKTTFCEKACSYNSSYGIFVGRTLRAKYGNNYFDGQAAPKHTENEALQIMDDEIKNAISLNKKNIFIDGQPRSDLQLKYVIDNYAGNTHYSCMFIILYCDDKIRRQRMLLRDTDADKLKLSEQRFMSDMDQIYKTIYNLCVLGYNNNIFSVNTEDLHFVDTLVKAWAHE